MRFSAALFAAFACIGLLTAGCGGGSDDSAPLPVGTYRAQTLRYPDQFSLSGVAQDGTLYGVDFEVRDFGPPPSVDPAETRATTVAGPKFVGRPGIFRPGSTNFEPLPHAPVDPATVSGYDNFPAFYDIAPNGDMLVRFNGDSHPVIVKAGNGGTIPVDAAVLATTGPYTLASDGRIVTFSVDTITTASRQADGSWTTTAKRYPGLAIEDSPYLRQRYLAEGIVAGSENGTAVYYKNDVRTPLPALAPGKEAQVTLVTPEGRVYGLAFDAATHEHTVQWSDGQVVDLGQQGKPVAVAPDGALVCFAAIGAEGRITLAREGALTPVKGVRADGSAVDLRKFGTVLPDGRIVALQSRDNTFAEAYLLTPGW